MPDNTISPESLAARARRAAEIARRECVVERCGPAGPRKPDPNGDDTAEYEPIRWESAEESPL